MNKWKKILLSAIVIGLCLPPFQTAQGRIREKVVIFNATTGHDHDGSTGGKLVYLPAIAITDVNVCASQVCQLALTAEEGDVCVRSDENKSYIHNGGVAADMTDWTLLLATGVVTSVNSETGAIINVERTTRLQTTISDSDSNYPSSGAVVDYTASGISTHSSSADAHHSSTSDGLDIIPNTVFVRRTTAGQSAYGAWITGDTSARYYVTAGGTIELGPGGASARDVNLYRHAGNQWRTNDAFGSDRTAGNACFFTLRTGDAGWRWYNDVDGVMSWGPGDASYDTNLYRSAANILKTDDQLEALNFVASNGYFYSEQTTDTQAFGTKITGDSWWRWRATTGGLIEWGPGSGARDTNLYRSAVNTLKTDDLFTVGGVAYMSPSGHIGTVGGSGGAWAFRNEISGDTSYRWGIQANGVMLWSDGAGGGYDTDLYRGGVNILQTDDTFKAPTITCTNTAANYTHSTTTKYLTVAAAGGFVPNTTNGVSVGTNSISSNAVSTTNYATGAINLPTGAIVTRLDAYGWTNDSGDTCTMTLGARNATGASTTLASCTYNNGVDSCNDTTITNATIASDRGYHLVTSMSSDESAGQAGVYYVKITYTVANVGQTL